MELLHFQRCDRFYEIINENLELAACRQELEAAGFSVDLGVQNLGNGKLLVPVELAERAIDALRKRQRQTGKFLTSSDVVVTPELKAAVCEQVERRAARKNPVTSEPLEVRSGLLLVPSVQALLDLAVFAMHVPHAFFGQIMKLLFRRADEREVQRGRK